MHLLLIALAAGYGAVAGLFVPRAAYRLAVEPEEPWRAACPAGHVLDGAARGWFGLARCLGCAAAAPGAPAASDGPADPDDPVPGTGSDHGTQSGGAGASVHPVVLPEAPGPAGGPGAGSGTGAMPAAGRRAGRGGGRYGPGSGAVATGGALVCGALAAVVGARPELAVWLLLVPFLLVLALVDRAVHRLPDVLTLPLPAAATALLGVAALLPAHAGSWTGALLGGVALGGVYVVLFLIHPSGMGFGDVKLALTLGIVLGWYGWAVLFAGAFAGFLLGALYGAGLLLARRAGRKTALPFGPFMMSGTFLALLLGGLGAA